MTEVPEHLLRRSRERRKQLGLPVDDDEPGGEEAAAEAPAEGGEAPAEQAAPTEQPAADAPAAEPTAQPAPAASAGGGGAGYFEELSQTTGVPPHLLERSARRRSQLTGEPMPGGDGGAAPAGAPAQAPAAAATATATAPAPPSTATGPEGHTHRLLTVVKAGSIQQTKASPVDKVHTWPHLLAFELTALLAVSALLIIFSAVVRAPLLELADPNLTPNPSKAPWYFLGLQEILTMFHPMVAGVLIPGYGLLALGAAPYVDKNPATDPNERKFAIALFTVFLVSAATLAIIGSFFRGPGFNFTFPWVDGIFFDL